MKISLILTSLLLPSLGAAFTPATRSVGATVKPTVSRIGVSTSFEKKSSVSLRMVRMMKGINEIFLAMID